MSEKFEKDHLFSKDSRTAAIDAAKKRFEKDLQKMKTENINLTYSWMPLQDFRQKVQQAAWRSFLCRIVY